MDGQYGDTKARVLEATDIAALIGRTVKLQRRGKDFVGLCPFHQEKTPSFHVSPGKQFFYCYGCKKNGNAIDFVIEHDRLDFKDALRQLAQAAGIVMPESSGGGPRAGEMQALRDAQTAACSFFENQLASPAGKPARDYLAGRGISAESIKRFRIGFAPDSWDAFLSSPAAKKFPPSQLALAGLVKPREQGGGFYDTFRNRVMFPIRDAEGRVIAFGGRVMPNSPDKAKYLNSPQTPLFDKGRCVFGLELAKEKVLATRTVAVVEGYTDVVMAHQFGCTNVVSILGTALTPQHVPLLARFADRIVLLFDPDTAGNAAADRAVELFLTQDKLEIGVAAALPDGLDPDEFLLQRGPAAFDAVLSDSVDALTYKWKQLARRFAENANDLTGQHKAVEEYLAVLAGARQAGPVDPLRWGAALNRVSRLTQIPAGQLHQQFKTRPTARAKAAKAQSQAKPNTQIPTAREKVEGFILGYLLCEPGQWAHVQQHIQPADFAPGLRQTLAEIYWRHQQDEGEPVLNQFLDMLTEPLVRELAAELAHQAQSCLEPDNWLRSGLEYVLSQRRRDAQQLCEARLRGGDPEEEALLAQLETASRIPDPRRLAVPYGA